MYRCRINPDRSWHRTLLAGTGICDIEAIAVCPDGMHAVFVGDGRVYRMDCRTGMHVLVHDAPRTIGYCSDVAVRPDGVIILSEPQFHQVHVLSPDGLLLRTLRVGGLKGSEVGHDLRQPIAVVPGGDVLVAERRYKTIYKLTLLGGARAEPRWRTVVPGCAPTYVHALVALADPRLVRVYGTGLNDTHVKAYDVDFARKAWWKRDGHGRTSRWHPWSEIGFRPTSTCFKWQCTADGRESTWAVLFCWWKPSPRLPSVPLELWLHMLRQCCTWELGAPQL